MVEITFIIAILFVFVVLIFLLSRATPAKSEPEAKAENDSFAPYKADDVDNFAWPKFFIPDQVRFLVSRIDRLAADESERRLFRAILRRAYEDSLELEILYRELPGVLKNDHTSIKNFREILSRAAPKALVSINVGSGPPGAIYYKPPAGSFDNQYCRPVSMIGLDRILLVAQGAKHVSRGDRATYGSYATTLRGLWRRTQPLEHLNRLAGDGAGPDGRDRLGEHLKLVARDSRFEPDVGLPNGKTLPGGSHPDPGDDLPDDLWPSSGGGRVTPPDDIWPPGAGGGFPTDYQDYCYVIEPCLDQALAGIGNVVMPARSTHARGISAVSPQRVCEGQKVSIGGTGFGITQPADVIVVIGNVPAEIVTWSDTEIVITVPPLTPSGCVGFRSTSPSLTAPNVTGRSFKDVEIGVSRCSGHDVKLVSPTGGLDPAPCTGNNFLLVGRPHIDLFRVNGVTDATVDTNTDLILTWHAHNYDELRIKRSSSFGPSADFLNPAGNSLYLGPFTETTPGNAIYTLIATNACGMSTKAVEVNLRKVPALQIAGVEVIQTLQRFNLASPTDNNSVPLVANKRTIARVYVDSGISDGFDQGFGVNVQPNIMGSIRVAPDGSESSLSSGLPLNFIAPRPVPPGTFRAGPAGAINRAMLGQTLNFELPLNQLSGSVRLEVKIWVDGHKDESGTGWVAETSVQPFFESRGGMTLAPVLVTDQFNSLTAPTMTDFASSVQGARVRYPIADSGFNVESPLTMSTRHDLVSNTGMTRLLIDLNFMVLDSGKTRAALIPDNGSILNGIAAYDTGIVMPAFVAKTGKPATFAHELSHTFWLGHSNCPPFGSSNGVPQGIDFTMAAATEDIGITIPAGALTLRNQPLLMPAGTGELMSYCGDQNRWPSIDLYNRLFGFLE